MQDIRFWKPGCGGSLEPSKWMGLNVGAATSAPSSGSSSDSSVGSLFLGCADSLEEVASYIVQEVVGHLGSAKTIESIVVEGSTVTLSDVGSVQSALSSLRYDAILFAAASSLPPFDASISEIANAHSEAIFPSVVRTASSTSFPAALHRQLLPLTVARTVGEVMDHVSGLFGVPARTKGAGETELSRSLLLTLRFSQTIEVLDSDDDDLGITLPPQAKTLYSQHCIRIVSMNDRESVTRMINFLSCTFVAVALRSVPPPFATICFGKPSSAFISPLGVWLESASTGARDLLHSLIISGEWRGAFVECLDGCLVAPLPAEMMAIEGAVATVSLSSSGEVTATHSGIDSTILLADGVRIAPAVTSPVVLALQEENRVLRHELDALKQRLALVPKKEERTFSVAQRSPKFAGPIAVSPGGEPPGHQGCHSMSSPADLLDSFALPSPASLRARRKQNRSGYGSFGHGLYYINTQDSFNFPVPPPFRLESNSLQLVSPDLEIGSSQLLTHSGFATLRRAEVSQRSSIEYQSLQEFTNYILAPYVAWLRDLAGFALAHVQSPAIPDVTALIISEMLEDHAAGMAHMMADIVDEKGAALFEAIIQSTTLRNIPGALAPLISQDIGRERRDSKQDNRGQKIALPLTLGTPHPTPQEIARRADIHRIIVQTGRNLEGDRLRSSGYKLPSLRVEALQEDTKLWRVPIVLSIPFSSTSNVPASTVRSPITGGVNTALPTGAILATSAIGQHVGASLDDYRAMGAYNFIFLGETNAGKSSIVSCMTNRAPKLFKKCPAVTSPSLGVVRHQHFCSLQYAPTTMVPLGGMDSIDSLNVNMLMRDDRVTYNTTHVNVDDRLWPADLPVRPRPFCISQPVIHSTVAVNFVEIPTPVLELGLAAPCTGLGTFGGHHLLGALPSKAAVYFLTYNLSEDLTLTRRNLERLIRNVMGSLSRPPGVSPAAQRTVPFVLVGTHSDALRSEDSLSSEEATNAHHNTLRMILRSQRDWFLETVGKMLPQGGIADGVFYRPLLLDVYATSCKEWTVVGERPRCAADFESLCTSVVQCVIPHSPVSPLHFLPSLLDVVMAGVHGGSPAGAGKEAELLRCLTGGDLPKISTKASSEGLLEQICASSASFASCSLERFWAECTDVASLPVAIFGSLAGESTPQTGGKSSSFLSFVTGKQNVDCRDNPREHALYVADRKEKPCHSMVTSVLFPNRDSLVSAMSSGLSFEMGGPVSRGLPLYSGLEKVVASTEIFGGNGGSLASLTSIISKKILREEESTNPRAHSGYLLEPIIKRVNDWLSFAPYGMITLLTTLKRFADVSNVFIEGPTMTFLIHQHLGLVPFSLTSSGDNDGKRGKSETDSVLSPFFKARVESQYRDYQLYLEEEKRQRRGAKEKVKMYSVGNASFQFQDNNTGGNDAEDDSPRPVDSIRRDCPVAGLNNEKHWPPELIACRNMIVEHVVSSLTIRGILQPMHTTPSHVCFSIGSIWRDSLLSSLGSLRVAQVAALAPQASLPTRTQIVPMPLLSFKETSGPGQPTAAINGLASACGFLGSASAPHIPHERLLATLFGRLATQGVVSFSGAPAGNHSSVTWFATGGVPSEPSPWSGTSRLLTTNIPLGLAHLSPVAVHRYFCGYVSPSVLRALAVGSFRWLSPPKGEQSAQDSSSFLSATVASTLAGATSPVGRKGGCGPAADHYILQLSRYLAARRPSVLTTGSMPPLTNMCDYMVDEVGVVSYADDDMLSAVLAGLRDFVSFSSECLSTDICVDTGLRGASDSEFGGGFLGDVFVPQLVDRQVSKAVLDVAGFLVTVGCEYACHVKVTLKGSAPSCIASRVFASLPSVLPSFICDVYREWSTVATLSQDDAMGCFGPLIGHAAALDHLLRSQCGVRSPNVQVGAASQCLIWSNAATCALLGGAVWCLIARDDHIALHDSGDGLGERYIILVGLNAHHTLFSQNSRLSDASQVAAACAAAIVSSFVRETSGFHGAEMSVAGKGGPRSSSVSRNVFGAELRDPSWRLLAPLHRLWSHPSSLVSDIVVERSVPMTWGVVEEHLRGLVSMSMLDGCDGGGKLTPVGAHRLLSEFDYALQSHDVMIAASAAFTNSIDAGAALLQQLRVSEHLYASPMTVVASKKAATERLLVTVKHMVESTRGVRLDELMRLLEACM